MDTLPPELIRHIKSFLPLTRIDWKEGSYIARELKNNDVYAGYATFKELIFMNAYYHYIRLSFGGAYMLGIENFTPVFVYGADDL
jgi:hypothetical protein